MNSSLLEPYSDNVLAEARIPFLPNPYYGKVRENYDLPDGRRIIIATDRLSAFDRIITVVPLKGQILTQMARYWFEETADLAPNHVLEYPDPNVLVGRKLTILPVEIVVRDYLAGTTSTSLLSMYRAGQREMYGLHFPDGLKPYEKLPETVITPTTKAFDGGHDEPLGERDILDHKLLTPAQWDRVRSLALAVFARGRERALERGLILADTKYEFGVDAAGEIILADEIHTSDSSRYWFAGSYKERFSAGQPPESFDKDFIRSWVVARCDPYKEPVPVIPREIVLRAAEIYIDAYRRITGKELDLPDPGEPVLDRVRRNLARFAVSA